MTTIIWIELLLCVFVRVACWIVILAILWYLVDTFYSLVWWLWTR